MGSNWTYDDLYYHNASLNASANVSIDNVTCDFLHIHETGDFCSRAELPYSLTTFSWTEYTETVYGYVSPILVLITIVTNTLVSVVLLKKNMRSPTNVLLVAMAQSDLFTGLLPIPCFIYFFTLGNFVEWVPASLCYVYDLTFETLPTICHTASIWLTVALAAQRYVCVCHPIKAKQCCTIPNMLKVILGIYIMSVLSQITKFFEFEYPAVLVQSQLNISEVMYGCRRVQLELVRLHEDLFYSLYFWCRVIFIHLIPCTVLLVLNALLICALRNAQHRREMLLRQNQRQECRRLKESNCTTLMLVAVVGLFLLVEFPLAIFLILMILENTLYQPLLEEAHRDTAALFINLCILLSYPLNFFIYCGMSRQFRETFKRLFIPGASALDREHSQYFSLATENGGRRDSDKNRCGNNITNDTAI